jgi:ABC-type transport system involved in cytochrome bd biosynthesis fused ATPase/permease subunit
MRRDGWLRLVRRVGQRGDLPQQAVICAAALVERLLGPALVGVATTAGTAWALATGTLLSAIFALRGLLQTAQVTRTEAGLYTRVVDSVLRGDVLQQSVLPDEEARAALFDGAHVVASLLAGGIPNLCANTIAAAVFACFVAVTEPVRIVAIAGVCAAAGALLLSAARRTIDAAQKAESMAWVRLADGISDAFDGRLEIVAAGRAGSYSRTFGEIASSWRVATARAARVARVAGRLPVLTLAVAVGAAVVLDSILRGEPAGRILGQAALLACMSPAFVGVVQGLQEIAGSERRLQRILALVTTDTVPSSGGGQPPVEFRSVEVRSVHFAYARGGGWHEALSGVSFTWRAGELLALAGPNGSGKSTCLRLLLGLCKPASGGVLVNGIPMEGIDWDLWRRKVAFLPQRPYLPPRMTVRECLRFIDTDITEAVMQEAVGRVGLANVLGCEPRSSLDVAVETLSVGQKQRVGLARVLCRRAPIVMLDEPDANLDQAGVQLVANLARELAREGMVIVAAHSSRLLAAADRVLTLESGVVRVESTGEPAGFVP